MENLFNASAKVEEKGVEHFKVKKFNNLRSQKYTNVLNISLRLRNKNKSQNFKLYQYVYITFFKYR